MSQHSQGATLAQGLVEAALYIRVVYLTTAGEPVQSLVTFSSIEADTAEERTQVVRGIQAFCDVMGHQLLSAVFEFVSPACQGARQPAVVIPFDPRARSL